MGLMTGKPLGVLDHGFVRLVDSMGDDDAIVQAARVSYGDGTKTRREDAQLINYLMRNRHTSPFEMCEIKLHCKMPIFVARQWMRHRTASINEYSCRYSNVKDEVYFPDLERVMGQDTDNKQGSDGALHQSNIEAWGRCTESVQQVSKQAIDYGESHGVAREINRINMTVAHYTELYWKTNLHNLLHFLKLRLDTHAQEEIREYAIVIACIVEEWVPMAWAAFEEYILYSATFSAKEQDVLGILLCGVVPPKDDIPEGFSKGEWKEFCDKIEQLKTIGCEKEMYGG